MKKTLMITAISILTTVISTAQNVGIGVINPARARLELNGAVGTTTALFGGEGHGISFQKDFAAIGYNQYNNNGSKYIGNGFAAVQWLHQNTGWLAVDMFPSGVANGTPASVTRAITLTPQGHLAIGSAAPNGDLQFTNTLNNRKIVLWESVNNDHQYYGFGIESGTLRYAVDAPGAAHRFYAGNTNNSSSLLMTIGGDKKVVIGTQLGNAKLGINSNNPQYPLEVMQSDNKGIIIIDPATFNNWELKTEQVASFGNYLFFRYNGTGVCYIKPDGSYIASDGRIKKNILALPGVLSRVMKLKPSAYEMKYNNPGNNTSIGFVAQDMKTYFPELVAVVNGVTAGYSGVPDLHTINYSGLSVVAVKAIQEQQQIIQALQQQVDELRTRLDIIEKR